MPKYQESAILYAESIEDNDYTIEIAAAFEKGYELCQKEYEEKLRWIHCYEQMPKIAELVIVDSWNDLHACVAIAFYENEEWKYANGQKLWFRPTNWRYFL